VFKDFATFDDVKKKIEETMCWNSVEA